jgi:glycosyltransferase involved in cell wall biosynthesis
MADIYTGHKQWEAQPKEYNGINIHPVPLPVYSDVYWIDQISSNTFLLSYMLRNLSADYDVVHCHSWIPFAAAHEFCRIHDLPLVTTFHRIQEFRDEINRESMENTFVTRMDRWVCSASTQVICVSEALVEQVRVISSRSLGVTFIPCGIDIHDFCVAKKQESGNVFDVLFIGRLVTEKGLPILLQSIEKTKDANIRLTVAGEGPEAKLVEGYRDTINIRLLGKVHYENISNVYADADLVVVPSYVEPFGIVVIEALASGKPVIASSVGGMFEILHGHDELGSLVPPNDPVILSEAIRTWISKNQTSDVMVQRREYVEANYSWPVIVHKHIEVYNDAISQKKGI